MPPTEPTPTTRPPARPGRESIVVAAVAVLGALGVFQVWRQPFSHPFNYGGDSSYYLMLVQGLERHGSFLTNPDLGFPFGQAMYDVPEGGDVFHLTILRLLVLFVSAPVAVNLFQLATFATIAAAAHTVLRRIGVSREIAAVAALVYTFLPFHLMRRNAHLFLSSYAFVPLLVLIALAIMSDRRPFSSADRASRWWVGAACLGLASTGTYYAVFAILVFGAAGVFSSIAGRSWAAVRSAVWCGGLILGMTVLNLAPSFWYWFRNGTNDQVIKRSPEETEVLGIRIQQLLMPRWDHRNSFLSEVGLRSLRGPFLSEGMQAFGVVTAVGFLGLLGWTLYRTIGRSGPDGSAEPSLDGSAGPPDAAGLRTLLDRLGFLAVVCLLLGTGSGFGYFVSVIGLRQIRAYNRISIVIAFCAVAALALVATAASARVAERRGPSVARRVVTATLALTVVVAWYDQTSPRDATRVSSGHDTWIVDGWFYDEIGAALPAGSAVLQLPHVAFPESPGVGGIAAYDPVQGYLHEPSLRWSFGGVTGRAPAPPADLLARPGEDIVAYGRELGFRAIVVDRRGFLDPGDATGLEARLLEAGAVRRGESAELRYTWFDLEPAAAGEAPA